MVNIKIVSKLPATLTDIYIDEKLILNAVSFAVVWSVGDAFPTLHINRQRLGSDGQYVIDDDGNVEIITEYYPINKLEIVEDDSWLSIGV